MSQRARSGSDAATPVVLYREGFDPYIPQSRTAIQERMIQAARLRELDWLRDFAPGVQNSVKLLHEMVDGGELVDRFRVTSGALSGFTVADDQALNRRYGGAERGENNKIRFINVSHRRYDRRMFCLDMSFEQCMYLMLMVVFLIGFLYMAYELDRLEGPDKEKSLFAPALHWNKPEPLPPSELGID